MHTGTTSTIKWNRAIAEPFPVNQGVRQGGILSTDLYKIYINPLLDKQQSGLGCKIGNVLCNTTAGADDAALMGIKSSEMQVQINISSDYAGMEGYKLQTQSVTVHIQPKLTKMHGTTVGYTLDETTMPEVSKSIHLGIIRTPSMKQNIASNIEENIKKPEEVHMHCSGVLPWREWS